MTNLHVGARVKVIKPIDEHEIAPEVGDTGEIIGIGDVQGDHPYWVQLDRELKDGWDTYWFSADELEIASNLFEDSEEPTILTPGEAAYGRSCDPSGLMTE